MADLNSSDDIHLSEEDIANLRKLQDSSINTTKTVNLKDLPEDEQDKVVQNLNKIMESMSNEPVIATQPINSLTENKNSIHQSNTQKKYLPIPKNVNIKDWSQEQKTNHPVSVEEPQIKLDPPQTEDNKVDNQFTFDNIKDLPIDDKKRILDDLLNNMAEEDLPDSIRICPNCDHDRKISIEIKPSIEDKKNYLLCMLSRQMFRKRFKVFNDKITIEFRELKQYEVDACEKELRKTIKPGPTAQRDQFFSLEALRRFLMSLSLYAIYSTEEGIENAIYLQPNEWKNITVENTLTGASRQIYFQELIDKVTEQLGGQGLFTVVTRLFSQFSSIASNLALHNDQPDFWKTT